MAEYTLFIDESSEFRTRNERWIVAGILCQGRRNPLEDALRRALGPPRRYDSGIANLRDLHLSQLREQGLSNERVNAIAAQFFSNLQSGPEKIRFLAVINYRDEHAHENIVDEENTYRLMLQDLIALSEATVAEGEAVTHFEAVIASRTNSVTREKMSTLEDIERVVLKPLEEVLEVGLASRGLVELVQGRRFIPRVVCADWEWGLTVADFLANTLSNQEHPEQERLIKQLQSAFGLRTFESFGAYPERRARISERDGQYIEAIFWWLNAPDADDGYLLELFSRAGTQSGAESARASLEGVIEKLWQQAGRRGNFEDLYQQLTRLESVIREKEQGQRHQFLPLGFRLRNFMLSIANHLGDKGASDKLIAKQEEVKSEVSLAPENFSLTLDFLAYRVEAEVNALEFTRAVRQANVYQETVSRYRSCCIALSDDKVAAQRAFERSRVFLKSETSWWRARILETAPGFPNDVTTSCWQEIIRGIGNRILACQDVVSREDLSRLRNYRLQSYLKAGRTEEAVREGLAVLHQNPTIHDIFWAARAASDAVLQSLNTDEARLTLEWLRSHDADYSQHLEHPLDLIWRELGILETAVGRDQVAAEECFKRSATLLGQRLGQSPVQAWLRGLLTAHRDWATGGINQDLLSYFADVPCRNLAEQATEIPLPGLLQLRLVSPY